MFERIAEDQIAAAMRRGEFKNLKGEGKPLNTYRNPHVDPMTARVQGACCNTMQIRSVMQATHDAVCDIDAVELAGWMHPGLHTEHAALQTLRVMDARLTAPCTGALSRSARARALAVCRDDAGARIHSRLGGLANRLQEGARHPEEHAAQRMVAVPNDGGRGSPAALQRRVQHANANCRTASIGSRRTSRNYRNNTTINSSKGPRSIGSQISAYECDAAAQRAANVEGKAGVLALEAHARRCGANSSTIEQEDLQPQLELSERDCASARLFNGTRDGIARAIGG